MTESYEDMRLCPVCNRIRPRSDMLFTHDCHGITFRLVCWECYTRTPTNRSKTTIDGKERDG